MRVTRSPCTFARQSCGTITVTLSATEPLYIAARRTNRAPGTLSLASSCAASAAANLTLLNVTVAGSVFFSGFYELSAAEPARNGLPHWVSQKSATTLAHLWYTPPSWVLSSAARGSPDSDSISFRSPVGPLVAVTGVTTTIRNSGTSVGFSARPVCPTNTYSSGSGLALACLPCGAYQFAPPGSTSASACACAPGAGLSGSTCAPCTGDTFRASSAANAACNACPSGGFALDGAQAPAGCNFSPCDQIVV